MSNERMTEVKSVQQEPEREQRIFSFKVTQLIWLFLGILEALIALRIGLKLIGANPAAVFAQIIFGVTNVFLWPFTGITPDPAVGAFQFEISSIIAMIVYALVAWGLTRLRSRPHRWAEG